jgi:hypothetical protein
MPCRTALGLVLIVGAAACTTTGGSAIVRHAAANDVSAPLVALVAAAAETECEDCPANALAPDEQQQGNGAPAFAPRNAAGAAIEQTSPGSRPALELVASFDGLGAGFEGPQGPSSVRNPSDNSLAVGLDHIIQTVNSRLAIFTKKGKRFDTTGRVLYGSVPTNTLFAAFTGTCEARNNGDAVVRYDQLANRWLVVMPIFRRAAARPDQPPEWRSSDSAQVAPIGVTGQPGGALLSLCPHVTRRLQGQVEAGGRDNPPHPPTPGPTRCATR